MKTKLHTYNSMKPFSDNGDKDLPARYYKWPVGLGEDSFYSSQEISILDLILHLVLLSDLKSYNPDYF